MAIATVNPATGEIVKTYDEMSENDVEWCLAAAAALASYRDQLRRECRLGAQPGTPVTACWVLADRADVHVTATCRCDHEGTGAAQTESAALAGQCVMLEQGNDPWSRHR
jgi:hypothetical protein